MKSKPRRFRGSEPASGRGQMPEKDQMQPLPDRYHGSLLLALVVAVMVGGCATRRSISNSGAHYGSRAMCHGAPRPSSDPGFEYRGELNEFDVLGVERNRITSEEEIRQALDRPKSVPLKPGSSILLVQSGAMFPDGPMIAELRRRFEVTPFSGVPPACRTAFDHEPAEEFSYSKSLRLAAARAGAETIICYWGMLESARRDLETKTISWVPLAGWLLPDESQHMRIRIKLALIDVRAGSWTVLCPEPFTDAAASTRFTRGRSDQNQVERLKRKAYTESARELEHLAAGS